MSMPEPTPSPAPQPMSSPFWWPSLQSFVAVTVVMTCVVLVIIRHFHPIVIEDKGLDMMVNTFYVLGLAAIIQYLFGSSAQSHAKDDTIKTQTTALAQAANTNVAEPPKV